MSFNHMTKLLQTFIFTVLLALSNALFAAPPSLIDADGLAEMMDSETKPIVLEVRYHPHRYFTVGHIEDAIQVQRFKDLGDNLASPNMRFPSHEVFQKRLRLWGINNDSKLVIYDDSSTALASRLYVMLKMYGFNMSQVKVLNGGTGEWSAFNELSKEATPTPAPGNVTLKSKNPEMLIEWMDVYEKVISLRDSNTVLVDARPQGMYTGEVIRHAVQGGHIPGAINIVSLEGTESQLWKDTDVLADMYKAIPKDKTVFLYCHDGFRMSLAYMQLESLGYKDVRLLNGGWSIWDQAMTLPVVKGDKPYDEEYSL
jgi:thiosulfate/3-mercaptopyruvate sulfurtransferase